MGYAANIRGLEIIASTNKTLATIVENRDRHGKIVKEAREGYVKEAEKVLTQRLAQLREGEIVGLSFTIMPPQDYTGVYNIAIKMLEMHTEDTIVLDGDQVRHMIMDEWDWQEHFIGANMSNSETALAYKVSKGW